MSGSFRHLESGRVTPEFLDLLDEWSGLYKDRPWQMGVPSYVVKALVDEIRGGRQILTPGGPPWVRPDWDQYFLGVAQAVAARGECVRSRVGAVLVKNNRIVSTGYNGVAAGQPSCLDGICPRAINNTPRGVPYSGDGRCIARHAEENCILDYWEKHIFIPDHLASEDFTLYITKEPCENCADLVTTLGLTTKWTTESAGIQVLNDRI